MRKNNSHCVKNIEALVLSAASARNCDELRLPLLPTWLVDFDRLAKVEVVLESGGAGFLRSPCCTAAQPETWWDHGVKPRRW